jgi:hypothetical protein
MKVWVIVADSGSSPSDCSWAIHSVYADEQAAGAMAKALNDEEKQQWKTKGPQGWPVYSTEYEVQEHPVVDTP